jgi:leucyl aminopeptidase
MISFTHKSLTEIASHQKSCDGYVFFFAEPFEAQSINYIPYFATKADMELIIKHNDFNGKAKDFFAESLIAIQEMKHVVCIGAGNIQTDTIDNIKEHIRHGCGSLVRYIEKKKLKEIVIVIDNALIQATIGYKKIIEIITETILLSSYEFTTFITDSKKHAHNNFIITFAYDKESQQDAIDGINRGVTIGNATNNARTWGDLPPSYLYPKEFAEKALTLLKKHTTIKTTILEKSDLEKLKMGGILGVCQGSIHEPRLLIAEYTPTNHNGKSVALVGKGVTFDTGGISIKPSDNMEDMKDDMAGGAAVISALDALASLNAPYRIIVAVPMVENMPSHTAIKPSDILTFYNGKTAEVKNTDAEGRLILADALSYVADIYKPDYIIDLATLTGACSIALGPCFAAILSQQDELALSIKKAGIVSGNRCWQLPLDDCYAPAVESEVADVCNIGRKGYKAGTITAGYFLRHFVPKTINWAHLDIASVSMHAIGKNYIRSHGATGFGVALLVELLTQNHLS